MSWPPFAKAIDSKGGPRATRIRAGDSNASLPVLIVLVYVNVRGVWHGLRKLPTPNPESGAPLSRRGNSQSLDRRGSGEEARRDASHGRRGQALRIRHDLRLPEDLRAGHDHVRRSG